MPPSKAYNPKRRPPWQIIALSNNGKNISTVTHLAGTVFSFIPALIVWVLHKNTNGFIADQVKEALNFQITVAIAMFISWNILTWIVVGFLFMPVIWFC